MNILILIPTLKRAGAERQSVDLANALLNLGHNVSFCIFERNFALKQELNERIKFGFFERKTKLPVALLNHIAGIIDRNDIEIVLGILQYSALVGYLSARISYRKPPVIPAIHTTKNVGLKQELQDRLIYRCLFHLVPCVLFVCKSQCNYWIHKFPELKNKSQVVHNGVDVNRFRRKLIKCEKDARDTLGIGVDNFVFSCIAGFRREKGHQLLIRAFRTLPTHAHLILAGDGELKDKILKIVIEANLEKRVHFIGCVEDVRPILEISNVLVLPSTSVETFSIAMLESMAMGVPVIASDIGGAGELIKDGVNGLLTVPGSVKSLTSRMSFALHSPDLLRLMGEASEALIKRNFTLEGMAKSYESALRQILTVDNIR